MHIDYNIFIYNFNHPHNLYIIKVIINELRYLIRMFMF